MPDATTGSESEVSTRPWVRYLAWALLALLAVTRFSALAERPLHHDEGVNAWKLEQVIETGRFEYDPNNYHGPVLYFLQFAPTAVWWLFVAEPGESLVYGMTERSLRSLVALAGCLVLAGLWAARDRIGTIGGLCAAALAGASCSFLYFSRDFIHEMHLVVFSLILYLAMDRFARYGRAHHLHAAAAAAAVAFGTKETSVLTFAALAAAALFAAFASRLGGGVRAAVAGTVAELAALFRRARPHLWDAALIAGVLWFLLFSSFLTHLQGPVDSLRAFLPWLQEAVSSGHEKSSDYYAVRILWPHEPALTVLAGIGLVAAVWIRERHALFLAAWSLLMLGGYSAIPYKTPWLLLNALLPMSLLAGWGVDRIVRGAGRWPASRRAVAGVCAGAGLIVLLAYQVQISQRVAFREFDDSAHALVYSQTRRDVRRLLGAIRSRAERRTRKIAIDVVSPEYWPLPFYLRDYEARFWGRTDGVTLPEAPLVIASPNQESALRDRLGAEWSRVRYDLRPGVELDLWSAPEPADAGS